MTLEITTRRTEHNNGDVHFMVDVVSGDGITQNFWFDEESDAEFFATLWRKAVGCWTDDRVSMFRGLHEKLDAAYANRFNT